MNGFSFQFRRITKCPMCKGHNGTLRNDNARCLLIDFTTSRTSTSKGSRSAKLVKEAFQDDEQSDDEMGWVDENGKTSEDKSDKSELILLF